MVYPHTGGKEANILLALLARTTSGVSNVPKIAGVRFLTVFVPVTAVSGTNPVLTIVLQGAPDQAEVDAGRFYDIETVLSTAATGNFRKSLEVNERFYRLAHTITGTTPSFTFAEKVITGA